MEKYNIENDISVFYITATSFPEGIINAFENINQIINRDEERNIFGISRPAEDGKIIYKAAIEQIKDNEYNNSDAGRFLIKKGNYNCIIIENFMENVSKIGEAFRVLTSMNDIDRNGWCLEIYKGSSVICLVVSGNNISKDRIQK